MSRSISGLRSSPSRTIERTTLDRFRPTFLASCFSSRRRAGGARRPRRAGVRGAAGVIPLNRSGTRRERCNTSPTARPGCMRSATCYASVVLADGINIREPAETWDMVIQDSSSVCTPTCCRRHTRARTQGDRPATRPGLLTGGSRALKERSRNRTPTGLGSCRQSAVQR